jgi:hypothetical protein
MSQVLRLLLVVLFVGFGLVLSRLRAENARRRGLNILIAFVLGTSAAVGLTQKDAWPFSPYPVLAEDATLASTLERVVIRAVDALGREEEVDPMTWSPLPATKIADWIRIVYPTLSPSQKRSAERFLLERAEASRRGSRAGVVLGPRRWLGVAAAPDRVAQRPAPPPGDEPFVALRAYAIRWRPREVLADPERVERRLLFDTARP